MGKSRKKPTLSGSVKAAGQVTSKPKKKRPAAVKKKTKRPGTVKAAAVPKSPATVRSKAAVRTSPTKNKKNVVSVPTTPSTVSSKSTTQSKRAVKLMGGLALQSPSSSKRAKGADVDEDDSLTDTVNYQDPNTILWLSKKGVDDALAYHFPDQADYITLDHHDRILLLVKTFKPLEIRMVLQGLLSDAGKDWRKLKMNKLRNMHVLAPEFARVCVDLHNATADLNSSTSVPDDIVVDHGKGRKKDPS